MVLDVELSHATRDTVQRLLAQLVPFGSHLLQLQQYCDRYVVIIAPDSRLSRVYLCAERSGWWRRAPTVCASLCRRSAVRWLTFCTATAAGSSGSKPHLKVWPL